MVGDLVNYKSELDLIFETRLNQRGANSKMTHSKLNILEPKLKQKLKKPNTPKSNPKSDFCSPRKFKNIRDMFRDMESAGTMPIKNVNSRADILSGEAEKIVADSCKKAQIEGNFSAKNRRFLGPSEVNMSNLEKAEKVGIVEMLHHNNYLCSPSTKPKLDVAVRRPNQGWNSECKVSPNDQTQKDALGYANSLSKQQFDGGSNSHSKKITSYFDVKHSPTKNVETRVGYQANQVRTGQTRSRKNAFLGQK